MNSAGLTLLFFALRPLLHAHRHIRLNWTEIYIKSRSTSRRRVYEDCGFYCIFFFTFIRFVPNDPLKFHSRPGLAGPEVVRFRHGGPLVGVGRDLARSRSQDRRESVALAIVVVMVVIVLVVMIRIAVHLQKKRWRNILLCIPFFNTLFLHKSSPS